MTFAKIKSYIEQKKAYMAKVQAQIDLLPEDQLDGDLAEILMDTWNDYNNELEAIKELLD